MIGSFARQYNNVTRSSGKKRGCMSRVTFLFGLRGRQNPTCSRGTPLFSYWYLGVAISPCQLKFGTRLV